MADEKKKQSLGDKIKDKIGLFLDKTFTFGGALNYDTDIINSAESQMGVDSWKDIDNQEDFDNFKKLIKGMQSKKDSGVSPQNNKDGGAIVKMKRGGMVSKNTSKTRFKPSVAGRLAKRGYGKAFKNK